MIHQPHGFKIQFYVYIGNAIWNSELLVDQITLKQTLNYKGKILAVDVSISALISYQVQYQRLMVVVSQHC